MNLKEIVRNEYGISSIEEINKIESGISSNAKRIVTADGNYILRKVKSVEQAITEYKISQELRHDNLSSIIILNQDNAPYIKLNNEVYNLQTEIPNLLEKDNINFFELGKTIAIFHSRVQKIEGLFSQEDRFPLERMWDQVKLNPNFDATEYSGKLTKLVEQCLRYNHKDNCYIHGDLGKWNLLFDKSNIYIIDFGEVRRGNNHFDISAVLSSTINWSLGDEQLFLQVRQFKKGYVSNFQQWNNANLRESFHLWFTRGMVALLAQQGINERTNHAIHFMMKKCTRIETVFKHLSAN
ncbi:phosphotransferase [Ornithinibacillus sp. BX22]|uniref:Phosphotransferase n=1 Tax=Ornithinibacillus hominis TaxID=2763055 RepID=A0A923L4B7_9BACI|nr:phosphotransferase [Ornithinibacillus hominis]MBC5636243.1 phosphotransferase [Ornithinibacillus hominis]